MTQPISAVERPAPMPGRAAPLLYATGLALTGDGALTAAVPLLAATLTRDPLTLSLVSAAALLPWLLFGLHAGALTDRWARRRTMAAANLTRAGIIAAVAALTATGHISIPVLAVAVTTAGIAQCLFASASQGMIPALAGRNKGDLTWLNGKLGALDTAGRWLAGPSLGSLLFAAARALPFAGIAAAFLASAAFTQRLPEVPPEPRTERTTVTADVREGIRFVLHHPQLRTLALFMCVYNAAFTLPMATFVLFAGDVLGIPAAAYGTLFAVGAAGGIAAGWAARPLTAHLTHRAVLIAASLVQGAAWAAIALTGNVWVTGAAFILTDAAVTLATVAIISARQEITPDRLLGRVTAVFRLGGVGIPVAAALAGGALADAYGLRAPLYAASAVFVVLAAATAATRSLDKQPT